MSANSSILFERKNPFYERMFLVWKRCLDAYGGGAGYIGQALVKHMSEVEPEYYERLKRASYINYPRRIATLITQYVLSTRPERYNADADIVEDWSRTGLRVDEVMRQFSTYLNICGCAWLAVDMPSFDGFKSKYDEQVERLRPYCVALNPMQVPDWCYGSDGKLLWVLEAEKTIDNSDPFTTCQTVEIRKLWTRDSVTVVSLSSNGERTETVIPHNLGCVPFVRHVEVDGFGIGENHWFEDVVRISDAILNDSSEAQMNVVKQMFGLLVVPEDFLEIVRNMQKSDSESGTAQNEPLSHVLARSAALYESMEAKGTCRYISPSGVETATIRAEIDSLRKEMYSVVGLASSKDNTRAVESAEAKAWDYQNVEHYMSTRADVLEQCEGAAWVLFNLWTPTIPIPTISYNRNFSILDLKESVATLLELSGFNPENDDYQREIGKTALAMLNRLRQLSADKAEDIVKQIEQSTPGADKAEQARVLQSIQAAAAGQQQTEKNDVDASGINA